MTRDAEVVVVGAGAAGLAAAVSAAQRGLDVVVLERQPHIGGTTRLSVGSFTAAGSSLQRRAGILDDAAGFVEDMRRFDPGLLSGDAPHLRELYAQHSGATIDWLLGIGVTFAGPFLEPPHRTPRMHNVVPDSRAYIARLDAAARAAGVCIRREAEVTGLVVDGEGVSGVSVRVDGRQEDVRARRGVVLATGDFSASDALRAEHLTAAARGARPVNPAALGLGHRLAGEVGGELVGMEHVFGPQLRFPPPDRPGLLSRLPLWRWLCSLEAEAIARMPRGVLAAIAKQFLVAHMSPTAEFLSSGAVLVNREGVPVASGMPPADALALEPGATGYILLSEAIAQRFDKAPHHISTAPGIAFAYFRDYERGRPDLVARGGSAIELGRRLGVDPDRIQRSLASSHLRGSYIALGPVHSMLTVTEGAIRVDDRLRVMRPDGSAISGLHAVGGVGQGGMLLLGHGHHIGWALTSGRVVGGLL
ncbi:FAD-dependent oxidoreductase [Microbacterium ulmi]|uniref:FAD-dependent oxidoreductase n=1 Tax=Microbacterium ulmi TaxID=179095 RepID=A0A7Y2PZD7_9MICO|nr:fumarate reductase flavoprotein subunit [Microbacterium ulmi]NNH03188.1 FAD-dependent oxidoreductase [Microbacterium ulmi]